MSCAGLYRYVFKRITSINELSGRYGMPPPACKNPTSQAFI